MDCGYVAGRVALGMLFAAALGCHRAPPAPRSAEVAGRPSSAAPLTADVCRACDGDFGVHGLDPTPRCNCRTHDAGKRCRGKNDCEAECVGDGAEREITDPGPPPRGFWLGRCAELQTTFGCHVFLPARPSGAPAVPLDAPPTQLCVD